VPGHADGQEPLIYLVSSAQAVATARIPFVFTNGHATMAITEFYDDLSKIDQVDWAVMCSQYWLDSDRYPDRKRRRQAEFLIYEKLPFEQILGIAVINVGIQQKVQEILCNAKIKVAVQVMRNWYY